MMTTNDSITPDSQSVHPPAPFVLRTGKYAGKFASCVPTLVLDDLLADHLHLADDELNAVASELRFRIFLRRAGLAQEPR
jgi:hypothetical protein